MTDDEILTSIEDALGVPLEPDQVVRYIGRIYFYQDRDLQVIQQTNENVLVRSLDTDDVMHILRRFLRMV